LRIAQRLAQHVHHEFLGMMVVILQDDIVGRHAAGARCLAFLGPGRYRDVREGGLRAHGAILTSPDTAEKRFLLSSQSLCHNILVGIASDVSQGETARKRFPAWTSRSRMSAAC